MIDLPRRTMLQLLMTAGVAAMGPGLPAGAKGRATPLFLVLDDIGPDTPAELLQAFVAPMQSRRVPLSFIIKPRPRAETGAALAPCALFLKDYFKRNPGLGEIVAFAPDIADLPPYFKLRAASMARDAIWAFFGLTGDGTSERLDCLTLACPGPDKGANFEAVRAAGFRNLMVMSPDQQKFVSDRCSTTLPCLKGASRLDLAQPVDDLLKALEQGIANNDNLPFVISMAGAGGLTAKDITERAVALLAAIVKAQIKGRIYSALPRENIFWFDAQTSRLVTLILEEPAPGAALERAGFMALRAALDSAKIDHSVAARILGVEGQDRTDCLQISASLPDFGGLLNDNPKIALPVCGLGESPPAPGDSGLMATGLGSVILPEGESMTGLGADGILRLQRNLVLDGGRTSAPDQRLLESWQDLVVTVSADAYATSEGVQTILRDLGALQKATTTRFSTFPAFLDEIWPSDPVHQLMLATRRDRARFSPPAAPPDAAARAALLDDARHAWKYFERMKEKKTGLVAATVAADRNWSQVLHVLTMWDYGSMIRGVISAHELGLIDDAAYLAQVDDILRWLPAEKIGKLTLPGSEMLSDRGGTVAHDFNACDTGRLLSALDALNRYPLSAGAAAGAVAKWDLAGTIRDGRINSIRNGRNAPEFYTHCGDYTARAYGLWGHAADSPYQTDWTGSQTDDEMGILYMAARIGAMGAEPLLLDTMELGGGPAVDYLTDVLCFAQQRAHAETGELYCVSEAPIDRDPWFIYEGLVIDSSSDRWALNAISVDPKSTLSDRRSLRLVSCKAAFLWAALRPGPYSDLLVGYVREKGRIAEGGFASGIYVESGKPTANYTDINTNGIILQSVAHVLAGGATTSGPD